MKNFILAIDASFTCTGWAIVEEASKDIIELGKITTTTKLSENNRMLKITNKLVELQKKYNIKEACIEGGYVSFNKKTGMQLAKLRGAIVIALCLQNCKVESLSPSKVKMLFMGKGKGTAKKEEVAKEVKKLYSKNELVKELGEFSDKNNKAKNSDVFDAISIAVAYINNKESKEKVS